MARIATRNPSTAARQRSLPTASLLSTVLLFAGTARAVPPPCPHVLFVLDASESMSEDLSGRRFGDPAYRGPSKFELSQQFIGEFVKSGLEFDVPVGVAIASADPAGANASCTAAAKISVPVGHAPSDTADVLRAVISVHPSGASNLGEVVDAALADPRSAPMMGRPTHLIVITDGKLGCNSGDAPNGAFAIGRVAQARAAGLTTFVVGFGDSVRSDILQALALAGGEPLGATCERDGTPCYETTVISGQTLESHWFERLRLKNSSEGVCDDTCRTAGCPMGQLCVTTEFKPEFHCESPGGAVGGDGASGALGDMSGGGPTLADRGCGCKIASKADLPDEPRAAELLSLLFLALVATKRRFSPRKCGRW